MRTCLEIVWYIASLGGLSVALKESPTDTAAALIIGGMNDFDQAKLTKSVELFGCPGEEESLWVDDFPSHVMVTGGIYLEEQDKVLVCGGWRWD